MKKHHIISLFGVVAVAVGVGVVADNIFPLEQVDYADSTRRIVTGITPPEVNVHSGIVGATSGTIIPGDKGLYYSYTWFTGSGAAANDQEGFESKHTELTDITTKSGDDVLIKEQTFEVINNSDHKASFSPMLEINGQHDAQYIKSGSKWNINDSFFKGNTVMLYESYVVQPHSSVHVTIPQFTSERIDRGYWQKHHAYYIYLYGTRFGSALDLLKPDPLAWPDFGPSSKTDDIYYRIYEGPYVAQ